MNVVILSGNLARDPETKFTPSGQSVTDATVCVSERWTTEAGEQKERTAFVGLVFWGKRGEAFAKHHRKGSRAMIRGKIVQETWDDKETGKKREKTKVQVEDWEFAGSKPEGGTDSTTKPAPAARPGTRATPQPAPANNGPLPEDDDVPF